LGSSRNKTIWWWDSFNASNAQSVIVLCFFVLLAGITGVAVGGFVRGLARAWIFLGTSVLSFILIFVAIENAFSDGAELFFTLIAFYLTAALIASSYFRFKAPESKVGMVFQPIFGGCLLLSFLILTILGLARSSAAQDELFGQQTLPGWAVLVITTAVIGSISAIVAGILGVLGMRRIISKNIQRTAIGFAIASLGMPFIATMVWIFEVINAADIDDKGMRIFLAFRVCGAFCALLMLTTGGLLEIFVDSHFTPTDARTARMPSVKIA
jgi:hypothetical protein